MGVIYQSMRRFQVCCETELLKIVATRCFPLVLVVWLLGWLAPAPAWAQKLYCKPCWHSFGEVQVGSSSAYSFQLTNAGDKTLKITSASEQGSAFSLGNFPLPVNHPARGERRVARHFQTDCQRLHQRHPHTGE